MLFLLVFGSKFGCPGLQKQAFGMEGIAKINFRRNWISHCFQGSFFMILGGSAPVFMTFVALETGLKTDRFSGLPGGTPEFRQRTSGVVTLPLSGGSRRLEDHLLDD